MKNNIYISIIGILSVLLLITMYSYNKTLKEQTKKYKEDLQKRDLQLSLVEKQNLKNIEDFEKRELSFSIKEQELKKQLLKTEEVSKNADIKDCINQPINTDISKLLQEQGI